MVPRGLQGRIHEIRPERIRSRGINLGKRTTMRILGEVEDDGWTSNCSKLKDTVTVALYVEILLQVVDEVEFALG
jgi:hypothetical protein